MRYFWSHYLFIVKFPFICLLVLPLFIICTTSSVISILTHILLILWLLCPLFTNYKFALVSCTNSGFLNFHVSHFKLRKIQIMSTKYPKHAENDYGINSGCYKRSYGWST